MVVHTSPGLLKSGEGLNEGAFCPPSLPEKLLSVNELRVVAFVKAVGAVW